MYVPKSQRVEGVDYEDAKMSHLTINERLDEIWKELEDLGTQFSQSGSALESKKLDDQERLIKTLSDHMEETKVKVELFQNENKRKERTLMEVQNNVSDMMFSKAEKEEVALALETKCDKKDLEFRVTRSEFLATVEDLGESIEGLVEKFQSNDEEWHSEVNKINGELKLKLATEDYHTLQIPIRNRIRALMYGFKKMKSVIHSTLYPDASGITKCVSCGRPAELAGSKCKPSGDANVHAHNCSPSAPEKTKSMDDLAPLEPDDDNGESGKSFVSLPASSVNMMDKSMESGACSPMENENIGLRKRKPKREVDDEFAKLMATSPKTRFCGGAHTRTSPQERGIQFCDIEVPPLNKDLVSLAGYDQTTWYKGAVPVEKPGELPYDVDPDSVNVDELLKECYRGYPDPPPRDARTPRYCGGTHTTTEPLQKGLQFAPFRLETSPVKKEEFCLVGQSGRVFKGAALHVMSPNTDDITALISGVKGRPTLQPKIVSLPCGNEPSQVFSMRNQDSSVEPKESKSGMKKTK